MHAWQLRIFRLTLPTCAFVWAMGACTTSSAPPDEPPASETPETFEEACALVEGCEGGEYDLDGPRELIYRVDLALDDSGAPTFAQVDAVEILSEMGQPMSAVGGTHLVVAMDADGQWLEARAVEFPTTLLLEGADEFRAEALEILPSESRAATYFRLDEAVAEFVVLDEDGNELASEPPPVESLALGTARQRAVVASAACSHALLLDALDGDKIPRRTLELKGFPLAPLEPGPVQRAVVQAALNRMAPTLCYGIGRIGFMKSEDEILGGYVAGSVSGDLMLLNINKAGGRYAEETLASDRGAQLELMNTIFHEAGHTVENLLNYKGKQLGDLVTAGAPPGAWTVDSSHAGFEKVESLRLAKGLGVEWQRMQADFTSAGFGTSGYFGLAAGDCPSAIKFFTPQQVTNAGFMSRYGGTKYVDDIADMVAMPSVAPLFRAEGHESTVTWDNEAACGDESLTVDKPEDSACRHFRAYDGEGNIPIDLAAAYAKLRMLRDLDVITQAAFDECVGPVGFEVPGPGFHIYSNETFLSSFDQGVTASIGTDEGAGVYVFLMNGEGQANFADMAHDATMTLRLNLGPASDSLSEVSWPRGGYKFVQFQGNENNFILDMPGAPAGSFEAMEGFALVTASSSKRIEGSVVLLKVWRLFAPIPVPEVYDPPLVIRFQIDK